jgi:predicted Zn-dependent protease
MLEREADQSNHSMNAERALPFLRTHPQGDVRLANIEKHLPAAMKVYRETLEPTKAQKLNTSLVHAKGKEDAEKEVRSNQGQMSGRQYKQLSTDVKPDARA